MTLALTVLLVDVGDTKCFINIETLVTSQTVTQILCHQNVISTVRDIQVHFADFHVCWIR